MSDNSEVSPPNNELIGRKFIPRRSKYKASSRAQAKIYGAYSVRTRARAELVLSPSTSSWASSDINSDAYFDVDSEFLPHFGHHQSATVAKHEFCYNSTSTDTTSFVAGISLSSQAGGQLTLASETREDVLDNPVIAPAVAYPDVLLDEVFAADDEHSSGDDAELDNTVLRTLIGAPSPSDQSADQSSDHERLDDAYLADEPLAAYVRAIGPLSLTARLKNLPPGPLRRRPRFRKTYPSPPPRPSPSPYLRGDSSIDETEAGPSLSSTPNMVLNAVDLALLAGCRRASVTWNDEYEGLDVANVPLADVKDLVETAKLHKAALLDAQIAITDSVQLSNAVTESNIDLNALKAKYVAFIRTGWAAAQARDSEAAASDAAGADRPTSTLSARSAQSSVPDEIQADRVTAREQTLVDTTNVVIEDLYSLMDLRPRSHQDLMELESKLDTAKAEAVDCLEELRTLSKSAGQCGLRDAARNLTDAMDTLKEAKRQAVTSVKQARADLGLPAGFNHNQRSVNLKAPVFKGDFNDPLDFYSFKKKFVDYCETSSIFSHHERLLKLKTECVSGPALEAVDHTDTLVDAMSILHQLYARPKILFAHRKNEIVAMGACPSHQLSRRTWYVNMNNKLKALKDMSEEHGIRDCFDNSGILSAVQEMMQSYDARAFTRQTVASTMLDVGMDVSQHGLLNRLVTFVSAMATQTTTELDIYLTCNPRAAEDMLGALTVKKKAPAAPAAKPTGHQRTGNYLTDARPSTDNGDVSPTSAAGTVSLPATPETPREVAPPPAAVKNSRKPGGTTRVFANKSSTPTSVTCELCKEKHTLLTYCVQYMKGKVIDRWNKVCRTQSCFRCMRLDAKFDPKRRREWWAEHQSVCDGEWACQDEGCSSKDDMFRNHFTLCARHIRTNKPRQDAYAQSLDQSLLKEPKSWFYSNGSRVMSSAVVGNESAAIYLVHEIPIGIKKALLFYDSGCQSGATLSWVVDELGCKRLNNGPTKIEVAGGGSFTIPGGEAFLELPLAHGAAAKLKMLEMPEISSKFPLWDLQQAWEAISIGYVKTGKLDPALPTVPSTVGGRAVDIMVGIRYLAVHPTLVFSLPSGLSIYKSVLCTGNLHSGLIGGPAPALKNSSEAINLLGVGQYLKNEMRAASAQEAALHNQDWWKADMDEGDDDLEEGWQDSDDEFSCDLDRQAADTWEHPRTVACYKMMTAQQDPTMTRPAFPISKPATAPNYKLMATELKEAAAVNELAADITYRCVTCRNCGKCRDSERLEHLSLKEESEQGLIERCVCLDPIRQLLTARLPFIADPDVKLTDNKHTALRILSGQLRQAEKNPALREAMIKSHDKLRDKGFVIVVDELEPELRRLVLSKGYYIPWRHVHNPSSLSTPCRLVFDASSRTPGGESLNDVLAKGANVLAKLFNLLVKFRCGPACFSADISMAYNNVRIHPDEYCYQKYLWSEGLTQEEKVVVMCVVTLIYGVRPSGNLTIAGIQAIVDYAKGKGGRLELGAKTLQDSTYVDDIFGAFLSESIRDEAAVGVVEALAIGGMSVKEVTKSGSPPTDKVSANGVDVGVVGYKWEPVRDVLKLDIKPITFKKAKRGLPSAPVEGNLLDVLSGCFTKRVIAGQVASVFDPLGWSTPILGKLKLDMSSICRLKTDWDDKLPAELLPDWGDNLASIRLLSQLEVPRNIGLQGAGDKLELLVCTDASQQLAVATVYCRTIHGNGSVTCQLMCAKSGLANKLTIPRGELKAAKMGASIGHAVSLYVGPSVSRIVYATDSTIVLFWLTQDSRPLQTGVRNAIIEIRRLTDPTNWYHVSGTLNPADIGTRNVAVSEILQGSVWMNGHPWMSAVDPTATLTSPADLTLSHDEKTAALGEIRSNNTQGLILSLRSLPRGSELLINPIKGNWRTYRRRVAIVLRVFNVWRHKTVLAKRRIPVRHQLKPFDAICVEPFVMHEGKPVISILPAELEAADHYVHLRTSERVRKELKPKTLEEIGKEKDGVIYYTGRILADPGRVNLISEAWDLAELSFCRPVVMKSDPVAESIMRYAHEEMTHHGGCVATYRASMEIAFCVQGQALANEIRNKCAYCCRYKAKVLEFEMGPLHHTRLSPAPAYYYTQIDYFGHFYAYSEHHKKTTIKVYGVIFKCPVTLSIWVECAESYNTDSFIQAYTRFAARYGHPAKIFIDAGSQLKKACSKMKISYSNVAEAINAECETQVEFSICDVGSHQKHGIVERSVKEVRKIFMTVFRGLKLSLYGYGTAFAWISAQLNNLPICLANKYKNLDCLDLITPSRLLLGRNSNRAITATVKITSPGPLMKKLEKVSDAWWNLWRTQWIANLVPKPTKWAGSRPELNVSDIVLFKKSGADAKVGQTPWRTGRVVKCHKSNDGLARSVDIEYRQGDEGKNRETTRSGRSVAVLVPEHELDGFNTQNAAAVSADRHYMIHQKW